MLWIMFFCHLGSDPGTDQMMKIKEPGEICQPARAPIKVIQVRIA